MADIKVRDLTDTQTINTDDEIMVLTNAAQNQVQNITVENFITNVISSDSDNVIEQRTDGKLYVETPVNITGELADLTTVNKTTLVAAINEVDSDLATEVTNRVNAVSGEATARQNADNNLQSQIDAITAASDVTDIVGTYAELQAYDTTGLSDKSVIKVLQDESRQNETTYYRWVITGGVGAWVLIGEEGPYYTISQADSKFATKATVGDLNNLATSDKSSIVNAMNELASVLDPTQTVDYIKNSKAIYSGEVSENALILPQIKEMAYSTFDRSKFTVVGSPTITDDGIASGFSGENYLKLPNFDVTGKSFEFDLGKVYVPASTGASHALFNVLVDTTEASNVLNFAVGSAGEMYISGANKNAAVKYLTGYSLNNYYWLKIGSDNSTIVYCKISTDGVNYTTITTPLLNPYTLFTYLGIGRGNNTTSYWLGDYDLRQFKLSVDGVEVFSGNRTGIDTIKPDNYTVVGTPTISADGIITNSDQANNYIYIPETYISQLSTANTWKVKWSGTLQSSGRFLAHVFSNDAGIRNDVFLVSRTIDAINNFRCIFYVNNDGTRTDLSLIATLPTSYNGKKYIQSIEFTGTQYIWTYQFEGESVIVKSVDSTYKLYNYNYNDRMHIGLFSDGSIDLNAFKIYVDGNLVYQPCLKIPYTYAGNGKGYNASTGSKIVQSIYRDRISDMYEQFGYAPYYTLSDTDFTLPQGELYGMIERNNVEIGVPIPTLSSTLRDNEIWLKGDSVAKVDYPRLYAIYGDDYEDSANPTDNDHFRLPNFVGNIMQGIDATDTFGYISAGLPNITGNISVEWAFGYSAVGNGGSGALYNNYSAQSQNGIVYNSNTTNSADSNIRLDASRSSSIYGNSTTVQPPAIKVRVKTRYK